VKVQYFGDVNDYCKYALLRLLAKEGRFNIGVCWMLTEPDESGHGDNRSFAQEPKKWREFDPAVFDALASVPASSTLADLQRVENKALIPGAVFFDLCVGNTRVAREAFHRRCLTKFAPVELAFFDPDNGLEIRSIRKGRKRSSKYVFVHELIDHYREGRSVLIYQHRPQRVTFTALITHKANCLNAGLAGAPIWAFQTAHVVFLLVARPEHAARVETVACAMEQGRWLPVFFKDLIRPKAFDAEASYGN
jgi:hypothetical protein